MRFRDLVKSFKSMKSEEDFLELFDSLSYSLGFSSLGTKSPSMLDLEASASVLPVLLARKNLRLTRFVGVYVQFLMQYHQFLNAHKLFKMSAMLEKEFSSDELPLLQLMKHVLKYCDSKRFKTLKPKKLEKLFYLEERLKPLVDRSLKKNEFFLGLSRDDGFMLPADPFRIRPDDLLPTERFLVLNEQLRMRLLFGANARADAILLYRDNPSMSARELSETIMLSYEPAHRLAKDIKKYLSFGYNLKVG